jgi:hypothetical protein
LVKKSQNPEKNCRDFLIPKIFVRFFRVINPSIFKTHLFLQNVYKVMLLIYIVTCLRRCTTRFVIVAAFIILAAFIIQYIDILRYCVIS